MEKVLEMKEVRACVEIAYDKNWGIKTINIHLVKFLTEE
jgi:hypothetical protein